MGKKWKKLAQVKADRDHKFGVISNAGNLAFLNGNMNQAIDCYDYALQLRPNDANMRSNRGAALVRVRAFDKALQDFSVAIELEVKDSSVPTIKTLRRLCKAKWALKEYDQELLSLLENAARWYNINKHQSDFKEIWTLIKASRRMEKESRTGEYDMVNLAQKKEQVYDCGEYQGPIEVQLIPGKGRGILATAPIKAGQVIMGCKAFAIAFPSAKKNVESEDTHDANNPDGDHQSQPDEDQLLKDQMSSNFSRLLSIVTNMLLANSDLCAEVSELYSGHSSSVNEDEAVNTVGDPPKNPQCIDLEHVVCHNGTLSGSNPDPRKVPHPDDVDGRTSKNTYGLWILPSYLNHSCVDNNADVKCFGDFMIVRATRNISAGDEVLVSYTNYGKLETESYSVGEVGEIHEFTCLCRLCMLTMVEPETFTEKRKQLLSLAFNDQNDDDLENIEMKLEVLGSNNPDLNFSIFWVCRKIASLHCTEKIGMYHKAACYYEKAYNLTESSGFFRHRIQLAIDILSCYIQVADDIKAMEWGEKLRRDLLITYGKVKDEELEIILAIVVKYDQLIVLDAGMWSNIIYYCFNASKKDMIGDAVDEEIPYLIENTRKIVALSWEPSN